MRASRLLQATRPKSACCDYSLAPLNHLLVSTDDSLPKSACATSTFFSQDVEASFKRGTRSFAGFSIRMRSLDEKSVLSDFAAPHGVGVSGCPAFPFGVTNMPSALRWLKASQAVFYAGQAT